MKILIQSINYFPELTGIGKYTGDTAYWLINRGHDVRVITAPPYYPDWKIASNFSARAYKIQRSGGITVFRCPLYVPKAPSGLKRVFHLASFALSSFPILVWNAIWRPDVVITIEPPLFTAPGTLLICKICGVKSWLHIQDFEVDAAFDLGIVPPAFRNLVLRIERFLMSQFNVVSIISDKMMEKFVEKNVSPQKSLLFPNWVDGREIFPFDQCSPMREELQIPPNATIALYSGNMGEKQGLEIVIEAAKKIQNDPNIVFVMCGTGAAHLRLKNMAQGLTNIRWIPLQPMERLNDLLNMADIHLLPQRADAADLVMPSKLTGMMASGRPVIATAVEGTQIAEALKDSGLTVPPGNVDAFTETLVRLTQDKDLKKRLGVEARRYAVEHWDKENVLRRFEQDLKCLVYGRRDLAGRLDTDLSDAEPEEPDQRSQSERGR